MPVPATADERCERIWRVVTGIPVGKVSTYGDIARLAGFPRGARLVGWALKKLPSGGETPWHRVVNAQGRLSFPRDSQGYERQQGRLAAEGVSMLDGRIDLDRYRWTEALDALMWGPLDDI